MPKAGLPPPLETLEERIGHRFADRSLLEEALTHASHTDGAGADYQRLEFLGDRVLGMLVAERLYREHPDADVGVLHRRQEALVHRGACAAVARSIHLGDYLRLSKGERSGGGGDKPSILADALEAVIAAVYLDGGMEATAGLAERIWAIATDAAPQASAKSRLQEWSQKRSLGLPSYETAPCEESEFLVIARLESLPGREGKGTGQTLRSAQQAAAQDLLDILLSEGSVKDGG